MSDLTTYRDPLAEWFRDFHTNGGDYPIDVWREDADELLASPVLAQIVADAKAAERERVAADLMADSIEVREAHLAHNAGRDPGKNRMRPDLNTWANALEAASHRITRSLRPCRCPEPASIGAEACDHCGGRTPAETDRPEGASA